MLKGEKLTVTEWPERESDRRPPPHPTHRLSRRTLYQLQDTSSTVYRFQLVVIADDPGGGGVGTIRHHRDVVLLQAADGHTQLLISLGKAREDSSTRFCSCSGL